MRVESIMPGTMAGSENNKTPKLRTGPGEKATRLSPTADTGQKSPEILREKLEQAVEQLNNTMRVYYTNLRFEIHEKSGEIMVKVLNSEDGSVVREIPPEKTLDMVAYFKEMLGLIIDKLI